MRAARRHGLAVELDVLGDVAPDVRRRRLEAQELLDGVGMSEGSSTSSRRWSGWSASTLPGPADQPRGGLVARAGQTVM